MIHRIQHYTLTFALMAVLYNQHISSIDSGTGPNQVTVINNEQGDIGVQVLVAGGNPTAPVTIKKGTRLSIGTWVYCVNGIQVTYANGATAKYLTDMDNGNGATCPQNISIGDNQAKFYTSGNGIAGNTWTAKCPARYLSGPYVAWFNSINYTDKGDKACSDNPDRSTANMLAWNLCKGPGDNTQLTQQTGFKKGYFSSVTDYDASPLIEQQSNVGWDSKKKPFSSCS